jgi:hypothetical protein
MNMIEQAESTQTREERKAKRPKRPTFERLRRAKDRPPFSLTEDDIDILSAHGCHRVIDSDQLRRLFNRKRNLLHRLHCLYHHGYILRPKAQKPTPAFREKGDGAGRPVQSVLSRKGKVVLAERRGVPGHTFDALAAKGSLEHERGTTEVMLRLELGAGERKLEWWHEMAPSFPAHRDRKGDRVRVKVLWKARSYTLWLRPDRIVSVIDPKKTQEKARRAFFLEKDRGTMPLERTDLLQSSILRKLVGYSKFYSDRKYEDCFAFRGIRWLFVTETKQRADNMRALYRKYNTPQYRGLLGPQRLFWFCDMATIKAHDNLFDVPWLLADGTIVRLSD